MGSIQKDFCYKKRIDGGLDFTKNSNKLNTLTVRDGINVDPFIVLSIIGIESNYGLNKGKYTVFELSIHKYFDAQKV